jgi:hypothetical protein
MDEEEKEKKERGGRRGRGRRGRGIRRWVDEPPYPMPSKTRWCGNFDVYMSIYTSELLGCQREVVDGGND